MGIFNADVIINIPPAFFSLQKSGVLSVAESQVGKSQKRQRWKGKMKK